MNQTQKEFSAFRLRALRHEQLRTELRPWMDEWRRIGRRLSPWNGRWMEQEERNRPRTEDALEVLDNTGILANDVLANGMMSLGFSPARRFYKGTLADKDLARWRPVAEWLAVADDAVGAVLTASNFYRATHEGFRVLGPYGVNAVQLREHARGMWLDSYEIGEYALAANVDGQVDTIYREFALTTSQMVEQFGWAKVSNRVQHAWNSGRLGDWHTVVHAIEPRRDRNPASMAARDMPWGSYYWEKHCGKEQLLRESGFNEFPCVVPRWSVVGGNVYGYGPGSYAVGDAGSLNHIAYRGSQLLDYKTEPPTQGPTSNSQNENQFMPGSFTPNEQSGTQPYKPIWEPTATMQEVALREMDVRQRINRAFLVDMMLTLSSISDTTQRTAAEIAKRSEEQLVQAGPAVMRFNTEYGSPCLKFAFRQAQRLGLIPPPPEELIGMPWEVDFDSVFVQAQRLIGTTNNDRFIMSVAPILQYDPTQVDVLDGAAIIRDYADRYSVRPKLLRDERDVRQRQAARAASMAAKEKSAMLAEQAGAAKNLAGFAAPGGAPQDHMSQLTGYNSPPAQSY